MQGVLPSPHLRYLNKAICSWIYNWQRASPELAVYAACIEVCQAWPRALLHSLCIAGVAMLGNFNLAVSTQTTKPPNLILRQTCFRAIWCFCYHHNHCLLSIQEYSAERVWNEGVLTFEARLNFYSSRLWNIYTSFVSILCFVYKPSVALSWVENKSRKGHIMEVEMVKDSDSGTPWEKWTLGLWEIWMVAKRFWQWCIVKWTMGVGTLGDWDTGTVVPIHWGWIIAGMLLAIQWSCSLDIIVLVILNISDHILHLLWFSAVHLSSFNKLSIWMLWMQKSKTKI